MSKTQLWSLQFSCRRLAREAKRLGHALDQCGPTSRDIEQHLTAVSQLIAASMERLARGNASRRDVLDLAAQTLTDSAWAAAGANKAADESSPSLLHRLAMSAAATFLATPDLITFLCSMQKTGVLLVDTADERFAVELEHGDIVHAHSDASPEGERLGDVLVESGVITAEQLSELLADASHKRHGQRLGARLQESQLATQAELLDALEVQIRRIFHRLFTAQALDFAFWEGPCVWGETNMRLNATMLLLDGARAVDESVRTDGKATSEGAKTGSLLADGPAAAIRPATGPAAKPRPDGGGA